MHLLERACANPTLIMTMASASRIIVSIYLCLYHLPHVCRTLVPKICAHPEMLHVYLYVLMCVIYMCT